MDQREYLALRDKGRKHMITTLKCFEFWGQRVGRINGDIKNKWSEARWYADLGSSSLFELLNVDVVYKSDPDKGFRYRVLDTANRISINLFLFRYMVILYKLFFYNVAYTAAMLKNPEHARDIVLSADHRNKIILAKPFIFTVKIYYGVRRWIAGKIQRGR